MAVGKVRIITLLPNAPVWRHMRAQINAHICSVFEAKKRPVELNRARIDS
jgi:hypothetical protein